MRVVVATEARFFVGPDRIVRAPTQGRSFSFWTRYLNNFDEVAVLARVAPSSAAEGLPVEGERVSVIPVSDFIGPRGLARKWFRVRREINQVIQDHPEDAFVGRVPGTIGGALCTSAWRAGRPFALEVVGDPYSATLTASLAGPASPLLAVVARNNLRRLVRRARAVSYVTRKSLQQTYPALAATSTTAYSSVELPEEAFAHEHKRSMGAVPHLIMVGTMSQAYKGHDVLLKAMRLLADGGNATRATFVGDGKLRAGLEAEATRLGLDVTFTGQIDSAAGVRQHLDEADLFVMPSRSEGLPRALIEAMARGLPAIGTAVGGIPELLDPDQLVPPDDAPHLAEAINRIVRSSNLPQQLSQRNLALARTYHQQALTGLRNNFYSTVRSQSEHQQTLVEDR